MQSTHCLNCNEALIEGKSFCCQCGQKSNTHRLTLHEITHEALHAFTHADKGFFFLIKELAIKPGVVAREYLACKRKKYFNPFSFIVIVTGFLVIISSNLQIFGNALDKNADTIDYSHMTPAQQKRMEGIHHRSVEFRSFVNKHVNIVLFISTPFMAFMFWLFYKRRGLYYAEHLTAVVFFNTFLMVITGLVFAPLIYFTRHYNLYALWLVLMLVFHVIYLAFAYKQFLQYKGVGGYAKTFALSLLALICWMIVSVTFGSLYIMLGH